MYINCEIMDYGKIRSTDCIDCQREYSHPHYRHMWEIKEFGNPYLPKTFEKVEKARNRAIEHAKIGVESTGKPVADEVRYWLRRITSPVATWLRTQDAARNCVSL